MNKNPYKFRGALDPVKDSLVCVPREKDVNRVIEGINRGEYWAILGPRQIGKTTFLRMLKYNYSNAHYIYFDLDVPPNNENNLYQEIIKGIMNEIPSGKVEPFDYDWEDENPAFRFFEFLKKFNPKDDTKKIILLFDGIDRLPFIETFLHIWRKLYHERYHRKKLNRYSVIITGSVDLIEQNIGPESPFNIAETFEIQDFSEKESTKLIKEPLEKLNIKIEPEAKEYLVSQVSGHPQMLQHLCYILANMAMKQAKCIIKNDVNSAIEVLFKSSSTLGLLKQDLKKNDKLKDLIKEVLIGKRKRYFLYNEFSISGVGAIVDNQNFCAIRNKIYERFLIHITEINDASSKKPTAFISYSHEDVEWKDKLSEHLEVLEKEGILTEWHDKKITTGNDWLKKIEEKINAADIAVLLISANFLKSDFIVDVEIPLLLKQKKEKGMIMFPIIVKHCAWKRVEWLKSMQVWNNGKPIEKSREKIDEIFAEIVDEIYKILENLIKKGRN